MYSKFGAKKVVRDGRTFDSKKEAGRYTELKLLQRAGKITDLRLQVPFLLIPSQYENGKCIERECKYIADFTYRENGKFVVEDVKGRAASYSARISKGLKTDVYIIKRKLMLEKYGIKIRET